MTATPFLQMLMDAYDPVEHDPSSMRLWACGGSPIPEAVVSQAAELLPACQTVSVYGRSKNMITTMCTLDDPPAARSATSDGAAVNGGEVRVVDASTGVELPRGEECDIAFVGPSHMWGDFNDEERFGWRCGAEDRSSIPPGPYGSPGCVRLSVAVLAVADAPGRQPARAGASVAERLTARVMLDQHVRVDDAPSP